MNDATIARSQSTKTAYLIRFRHPEVTGRLMTGDQNSCHAPIGQSHPHQILPAKSEMRKRRMIRIRLPVMIPSDAPIIRTMGEM